MQLWSYSNGTRLWHNVSFWKHLHQLGTFGFCRYGSFFESFHRFSLGFKSGLWGGWRTFTFLLWSHSNIDLAACLSPVGGEICWPHSQAFGTLKLALLKICLCLDPSIVPLDLWLALTVLAGQVWSCTNVLRGMDGVTGLIRSALFQRTLCIRWSFLNFLFHQITECFASCSQSFTRLFDKLQAAAMCCFFRRGWLLNLFECLCWQFLLWQVILSWLKNTGALSE